MRQSVPKCAKVRQSAPKRAKVRQSALARHEPSDHAKMERCQSRGALGAQLVDVPRYLKTAFSFERCSSVIAAAQEYPAAVFYSLHCLCLTWMNKHASQVLPFGQSGNLVTWLSILCIQHCLQSVAFEISYRNTSPYILPFGGMRCDIELAHCVTPSYQITTTYECQ